MSKTEITEKQRIRIILEILDQILSLVVDLKQMHYWDHLGDFRKKELIEKWME